ncbi:rRNA methyltransferase [Pleomorphomonas diazotrophica]|uniref:rRNA methyltransferase n=1 Tax=Pleomorphomonas diazotrophica TaxID=1166257 RepID=A0A1I4RNZ2_9HYPH|nr:small ribosomal subunit Rsm22 family protein [Pleomorphomonas diazotrophica]PKR88150.1 rRNA methyltransferase [Pleomorphomonas diazotrophica]SFM53924.1 small ribosomal subunit Rsm22 [Pleomorphomonas diazotrophica]
MSDRRLPPALATAVAERIRPERLEAAATRLSAGYRANLSSRQAVPDAAGVAAYAASRMPATYAAVTAVFDRLAAARPDFAPKTVLDLGAGPGTASWAAAALWPSVASVTMVEASADFRALAADLARSGLPALQTADIRQANIAQPYSLPAGPFDLTVVAYALTELDLSAAERLVADLVGRAGRVVIVEPGTPRDHGRLMAVRQATLAAGARILAPCPHAGLCPLPPDDWCHTSVRVERSRAHMRLKGGTVPFEDERYAYLVLESGAGSFAEDDNGGRILRPPRLSKHEIVFSLCRADGTLGEAKVASRDRSAFKAAGKLGWGDFLSDDQS